MSPELNITPRSELQTAVDRIESFDRRDSRELSDAEAAKVLAERAGDLLNAVDHLLTRLVSDHIGDLAGRSLGYDYFQACREYIRDEAEDRVEDLESSPREYEPQAAE